MSSVSITNVRDESQGGRVETWKTPWMAQREKIASAPSAAAKAARAVKLAADAAKSKQRAELSRRRRLMIAPLSFAALTALLLVLHQSRVLELFYPVGAVTVAALLYKRSPAHYLSFVVWLFFLTPEVRRLSDYFNGMFSDRSLIMLAPVIAAALCGMNLLTHFRVLMQRRAIPLTLIVLGIFYGYVIGMVGAGIAAASYTLISWLFPVLIAFHILVTWRQYPEYHRTMLKTFVFGGFVIALYGVYQYVSPPPWDAFWLLQSGMVSEGVPLPFGMRVASTMNSSGPFAIAMMACLLMTLAARNKMAFLAGGLAVPALIGTMSRSVVGGLAIGLVYLFVMLDGRSRLRLVGGIAVIVLLCSPVAMVDEISDKAMARFSTVTQLDNDYSYQVRTEIYNHFLSEMTTNIAGQGLGMTGLGSKLSGDGSSNNVDFDSGLMEVPYVLGWPGTLLYATGLLMLILRAFVASFARKSDRFAVAGTAAAFGVLAMMVFVNTLIGSGGMFFFIGVMLPVTGWRYAREIQQPARSAAVRQNGRPAAAAPGRATTGTAAQQHIAQPSTPRT
ncbi:O-antigen ligase family protein [Caballeronia sp. SEWSISQ10-4 2]|uniref:O-antigen ligase family protein n=1 Tax=Caballeronia sp. SEWSISQ10-4 2 TaxID=2937438 RepID=UPI002654FF8D|nr:O-antigen ligase family protein [Caballeronia sp. SEWSISQ10-4 2]MDN7184030.1 O-antigen ligase family protein [Caballeronia sp. SEWSISQ10-4 2]